MAFVTKVRATALLRGPTMLAIRCLRLVLQGWSTYCVIYKCGSPCWIYRADAEVEWPCECIEVLAWKSVWLFVHYVFVFFSISLFLLNSDVTVILSLTTLAQVLEVYDLCTIIMPTSLNSMRRGWRVCNHFISAACKPQLLRVPSGSSFYVTGVLWAQVPR